MPSWLLALLPGLTTLAGKTEDLIGKGVDVYAQQQQAEYIHHLQEDKAALAEEVFAEIFLIAVFLFAAIVIGILVLRR